MATAEEILQQNPEGHIVVGGDRFITVPKNLKRLGVQYDHNMETVVFDCPRYWDKDVDENRDMSQMAIYINYARSDGEGGVYADRYPVGLPTIDADNNQIMHFNWTISRNVTEVAGPITFLVCVMKTDADGNEERHWNSELCTECYISAGMETEEHPAMEYPDEVADLLKRMLIVEGAKDKMQELADQANDSAGQAYDSQIAAEDAVSYVETMRDEVNNKSAYIRNSYAPAIKGNVDGEIIRVDDVSPIEHDVTCFVHGKNLFNINDYVTETDYSNNKTIYAINADHLIIGRTYTIFSSVPMQWF